MLLPGLGGGGGGEGVVREKDEGPGTFTAY